MAPNFHFFTNTRNLQPLAASSLVHVGLWYGGGPSVFCMYLFLTNKFYVLFIIHNQSVKIILAHQLYTDVQYFWHLYRIFLRKDFSEGDLNLLKLRQVLVYSLHCFLWGKFESSSVWISLKISAQSIFPLSTHSWRHTHLQRGIVWIKGFNPGSDRGEEGCRYMHCKPCHFLTQQGFGQDRTTGSTPRARLLFVKPNSMTPTH